MFLEDYLEVRIVSEGQPLQEYRDPADLHEPGESDKDHHTRYIEAKTGAKFSVEVELSPGFDFHGADRLVSRVSFDGSVNIVKSSLKATEWDKEEQYLATMVDSFDCKRPNSGLWERRYFAFGTLSIGKRLEAL